MQKKIYMTSIKPRVGTQSVIRLSLQAFEALMEVMEETGLSAGKAASEIILQAVNNDLISYDREV